MNDINRGTDQFAEAAQPQLQPEPRAWGFWPTIGLSAVIYFTFIAAQIVIVVFFVIGSLIQNHNVDMEQLAEDLSTSGFVLSIASILTSPVMIGLCVLFAWLRKGITLKEYLSLQMVSIKWFAICLGLHLLLMIFHDSVTVLLRREIVPNVMVDAYKTAGWTPLLWFAIVILAPISEELFFRGFMFKGLEQSRMPIVLTIVITSFSWAILHLQYDLFAIFMIFLGGLLLGAVRYKTKSVYPVILMHFLQNFLSMIQTILKVNNILY